VGEPVLTTSTDRRRPPDSTTSADSPTVSIDEAPLTVRDIVRIARGAGVELGPVARQRIAAARAVVDRLVAGDALIYGLNTGLGHLRNERLPPDELAASQLLVVRSHVGAIGPPLPREVVRAAMAVRLAGIARGGAGASAEVADGYAGLLNADVTPVVPRIGSVGASDLGPMAAIGLVLVGEGRAEFRGEVLEGADALKRAGLQPATLGPKDGLTIVSANGLSIGHAALVVERATRLAEAADGVVALSLEASLGNLSIVDPVAAAAKPVAGQAVAAARIRALLEGSSLCLGAPSVQDPLSFRVAPQVHGAFREVVAAAAAAVDGELAAMDDNPLVVIDEDRMLSNGNFHPMLMTLALDALRPAIAHVGQLADRRTGHLWDTLVSDPASLTEQGMAKLGVAPLVRYSIAARTAELRTMAGPASLDVGPLDLGVEDHATNAPAAVRLTDEALDVLGDVLAGELMVAAASLAARDPRPAALGRGTRRLLDLVRAAVERDGLAVSAAEAHAAVRDLLEGPVADPFDLPA
jgi:histidine ammonia-lyase